MSEYYGTEAGADAYHLARGNAAWATYTSEQKLAAMYRGSLAVDALGTKIPEAGKCVLAFPGVKSGGRSQFLQWPREGAADSNGDVIADDSVPIEVEYAAYQAALQEAATPNSLQPVVTAGRLLKRRKIGEMEQEYAVSENTDAEDALTPVVTAVCALLAPVMIRRCVYAGVLAV